MADKFKEDGKADGLSSDGLEENFFEEFSFDDFEDEVPGNVEDGFPIGRSDDMFTGSDNGGLSLSNKRGTGMEQDVLIRDSDSLAPKTEIEPEDPMLGEFEAALAAEIQRVTREQEAEKQRIASVRSGRRLETVAGKAADRHNSASNVSGESIRSGGWSRRRRGGPPVSEIGVTKGRDFIPQAPVLPQPDKSESSPDIDREAEEELKKEAEREKVREMEKQRAAAARAERVKAARAAQAEAERQAAIARKREAEEEERRKAEALQAALAEDRKRVLAESRKEIHNDEEILETRNRLELEETARNLKASEESEMSLFLPPEDRGYDDDDDDYDDEGGGKGRTIITAFILLVLLLLGVGAGMTYFWSSQSVNRPGGSSANAAATDQSEIPGQTADKKEEDQNAVAGGAVMDPEESRYLEESREAQAVFEEEKKAALARAEELEREERNAMLAEAGMVGLPDISTRDLSEYLTEMPANGASICSTKSVMYSYDQMVKELYFLTVQYGDYISMEILGNTMDERAIYEAVIGNANATKHVIIYYTLEGSDYIDSVLAMNQLESYCKARKNGASYKNHTLDSIFEDVCIHVIPMANPDGTAVAQYGIDALRTDEARALVQAAYDADVAAGRTTDSIEIYAKTYCANAAGVDLDKNFDIGWEEYVSGTDGPSASGYKGERALSELETQAIVNLAETVDAVAVIGYGTTGEKIEYGYGYEGPAEQGVSGLADIGMNDLVSALASKTGYVATKTPLHGENSGGGAVEYFLHVKHIPAAKVMVGTGEAPLDVTEMSSIWKANSEIFQMIGNLYTNGL